MPEYPPYPGHPEHLAEYIRFARLLAETSGRCIMQYYRTSIAVEEKEDASPVTVADKEAEEVIRTAIVKQYPHHGIIGEEFGDENVDADYIWVIDPIDGTKSFISGTPLFGTLISLAYLGEPILGIIHLPALNQVFTGSNDATDFNGRPVRMRECRTVDDAILLTTDHRDALSQYGEKGLHRLIDQVRFYRTWGDCYAYTLLCAGYADIMIDPVLAPWDMYALLPIVKGAGGMITDKYGGDPLQSGNIIAAHPAIHSRILQILSP